jgi:uncharacterized membrane protein SirB2
MITVMSERLLVLASGLLVLAVALFALAAAQGNWWAAVSLVLALAALTFAVVDLRRRGRARRGTGVDNR